MEEAPFLPPASAIPRVFCKGMVTDREENAAARFIVTARLTTTDPLSSTLLPTLSLAADCKGELELASAALQTRELGCAQTLLLREFCRRKEVCRPNLDDGHTTRETPLASMRRA